MLSRELQSIVKEEVGRSVRWKTRPLQCQYAGELLGLTHDQFLFLYDMGTGKTKLVLDLFLLRRKVGDTKRLLVIAENNLNADNIGEQIEEHTSLRYERATGVIEESRSVLVEGTAPVCITTYSALMLACCPSKKKTRKGRVKMKLSHPIAKKIGKRFGMVVFDEIQNANNRTSLFFRTCKSVSKHIPLRYGTTATLTGRDFAAFWAPYYLIDHGETLGTTFGLFRDSFFKVRLKAGRWKEWYFDHSKEEELSRIIKHRSLSYSEDEVHDLPPFRIIRVPITLTDTATSYYDQLNKGLIEARGDYQKAKSCFVRLMQLCSGFISWKDDAGASADLSFDNGKLEWLENNIPRLMRKKGKVVVFTYFRISADRVVAKLKEMGVGAAAITHKNKKEKEKELRRFKKDKKCRVAVISLEIGSSGLNLQVASTVIYYERPIRLIRYRQSMKRCRRGGQKRRVTFYHLLGRARLGSGRLSSMEVEHLQALEDGAEITARITGVRS